MNMTERISSALLPAEPSGIAVAESREFVWGYAIRRERPNGDRDLFGFTPDRDGAKRAVAREERYWCRAPVRPVAVHVVPTNATGMNRHPVDGCRAGACPISLERGVAW
ncbi:hypothetical protein Van01_16640 [Micromonospora andamanensis]|uniref:Nucleotidyltransferase n=1 Tax=Micromonospora andamanensis TaxID=1287068 RepID=A0ABQ4HS41_9ACTN|nr:hypothetical protein Van01_16640 [Micromonospora andamanensis]